MDEKKIEQAVTLFLEGIGEDINREGLLDTPKRISAMCKELFSGLQETPKEHLQRTFQAQNNEMVIEEVKRCLSQVLSEDAKNELQAIYNQNHPEKPQQFIVPLEQSIQIGTNLGFS